MRLKMFKRNVKLFVGKILAYMPMIPKNYHCTVCGSSVTYFIPSGTKAEIFDRKKIIGGGYRKRCKCPICGANDRMRFLDYILEYKTDIYTNSKNHILHFAPEKCIEKKIRKIQIGGGVYYW